MAESEEAEESGISMVEVLQEEEERQLNAAAVLGAADDTQCTYDQVKAWTHHSVPTPQGLQGRAQRPPECGTAVM